MLETELKRTPGVRGAFTTDQAQRYDLSLACSLEILDDRTNIRQGLRLGGIDTLPHRAGRNLDQ